MEGCAQSLEEVEERLAIVALIKLKSAVSSAESNQRSSVLEKTFQPDLRLGLEYRNSTSQVPAT